MRVRARVSLSLGRQSDAAALRAGDCVGCCGGTGRYMVLLLCLQVVLFGAEVRAAKVQRWPPLASGFVQPRPEPATAHAHAQTSPEMQR